jgi:hypothetical protein
LRFRCEPKREAPDNAVVVLFAPDRMAGMFEAAQSDTRVPVKEKVRR